MKGKYVAVLVGAFVVFVLYMAGNQLNPNSRFCLWKIYKQADGTYQVWWHGRSTDCELSNATLNEAMAFRDKRCVDLKSFMAQKPSGERIK